MKTMFKAVYTKPLVIYLVVALLSISTFAGPADAMFVPAAPHQDMTEATAVSAGRATDMAKVQTAFESKILQQKLRDYGLSPEETMARVNKLSDEQIHQLATNTDSLQAGGDGVDVLVFLLLVAILVVLVLELTGHHVIVR